MGELSAKLTERAIGTMYLPLQKPSPSRRCRATSPKVRGLALACFENGRGDPSPTVYGVCVYLAVWVKKHKPFVLRSDMEYAYTEIRTISCRGGVSPPALEAM